jgi:hypothetical protein
MKVLITLEPIMGSKVQTQASPESVQDLATLLLPIIRPRLIRGSGGDGRRIVRSIANDDISFDGQASALHG